MYRVVYTVLYTVLHSIIYTDASKTASYLRENKLPMSCTSY